jgi:hypothetical protein
MKNAVFVLTMVVLPVASPAGADQTPAPNVRVKAAATKTPAGNPLAAKVVLAQETRIDPALVLKISRAADDPIRDEVAALKKKADDVLGAQWGSLFYVCYRKVDYLKECSQKAFSPSDQKAAGCLPTETVQACSEKLVKWCVYGHGNWSWGDCRDRRAPLLKELDSLEQQIHLIRPKIAAYANF